jgi:hypothetical protein
VLSLGGHYFVGWFLVALVHSNRAISLTGINVDIASDSELPFAIEVHSICSASTSQPRDIFECPFQEWVFCSQCEPGRRCSGSAKKEPPF